MQKVHMFCHVAIGGDVIVIAENGPGTDDTFVPSQATMLVHPGGLVCNPMCSLYFPISSTVGCKWVDVNTLDSLLE